MGFTEFVDTLLKRKGHKRVHKLGNKPTVYECYNWARDNYLKPNGIKGVTREEFYKVVSEVNKLAVEKILEGETVSFPEGVLMIRAIVVDTSRKPIISWTDTLKEWYKDRTLIDDKILVRKRVQRMTYVEGKINPTVGNHTWFYFKPNRELERAVYVKYDNGDLNIV